MKEVALKMVSDFRAKKYLHVFNTFIDLNKDGTIDKNDFLLTMREYFCTMFFVIGFCAGSISFKIELGLVVGL